MRRRAAAVIMCIAAAVTAFDAFAGEISPAEDYYEYVNGDTIREKNSIEGENKWNWFIEADKSNSEKIKDIIKDAVKNRDRYEKNSDERKIADFYMNYIDREERNGIKPLEKYFKRIDSCKNMKAFLLENVRISRETGLNGIFPFKYDTDMRDWRKKSPYLDSSYYVFDSVYFNESIFPEFEEDLKKYMTELFAAAGETREKAEISADNAYNVIRMMSTNADSVSEKEYAVYDREEMKKLLSNCEIEEYMGELGIRGDITVMDPAFERVLNNMLIDKNLDMFKAYNKFIMLDYYGRYLSEDFVQAVAVFEGKINNKGENFSAEYYFSEEKAIEEVKNKIGWNLSRVFCKRYFSQEEKEDVIKLCEEARAYYKDRINKNTFLAGDTKKKMIKKLDEMTIKAGWPDNRRETEKNTEITDIGIAENIIAADGTGYRINLKGGSTDREEWLENMLPINASAYYDPIDNSVYLPAGILQEPFYGKNYTRAKKLGGIGSIIGHEMSHALESTELYRGNDGKYVTQWNEEDYMKFLEKSEGVKKLYSKTESEEGVFIDGEITLKENIADLSGISCAAALCGDNEGELKEMFESYAKIWAASGKDKNHAEGLKTDSHSPEKIRVNNTVKNLPQFIRVYKVRKNDGMYLDEKERAVIWQ